MVWDSPLCVASMGLEAAFVRKVTGMQAPKSQATQAGSDNVAPQRSPAAAVPLWDVRRSGLKGGMRDRGPAAFARHARAREWSSKRGAGFRVGAQAAVPRRPYRPHSRAAAAGTGSRDRLGMCSARARTAWAAAPAVLQPAGRPIPAQKQTEEPVGGSQLKWRGKKLAARLSG